MVYTQKQYPPEPSEFPPPPMWVVWCDEGQIGFNHRNYTHTSSLKGVGQIRHMESLYKSVTYLKKIVIDYLDKDRITRPWRIWEWVGDRYILRYSGEPNDLVKDVPIFRRGAIKERDLPVQDVTDDDLDEVMASLGLDRD